MIQEPTRGFAADVQFPLASVVKLPQALVLCDRVARGELDGAIPVTLDPAASTPGPTGAARIRHPATVAVDDLICLAMSVSDNAAADALSDLVPQEEVTRQLHAWGYDDIVVRHRMRGLYDTVVRWSDNDMRIALRMAAAATSGRCADSRMTAPRARVARGQRGNIAQQQICTEAWSCGEVIGLPVRVAASAH